ncbi:MAG TPA: O-antigen ligase family protein [Gemmatimonadales bacterium]|jgi:hypothetical protein|nr:O-antigen ligase family protein [Gemmatimonadales bacterium]
MNHPASTPPLPEARAPVSATILAAWLGLGAMAVVVAVAPSPLFDLDRFTVAKELALNLVALVAFGILAASGREPTSLVATEVPLFGFAGWSALSALFATNRWLSLRALAVTVAGVVIFRAGRRVTARGAGRVLHIGLAAAVVVAALGGLVQAYGGDISLLAGARAPGGTFGNRNFLAHLLAIGAPLLLLLVVEARDAHRATLGALCLGLLSGAVVLTRSRAAWLAWAASFLVMALAWLWARRRHPALAPAGRWRLLGTALAAGAAAALVLPNRLDWRSASPYRDTMLDLTNYRQGSGHGRLIQYRNTLHLAELDPVFGTGPGNWPVKYPLVTTPGDPSFAGFDSMPTNPWPSSDWVAVVAERGAVAALLLLATFLAMGLTALLRLRGEEAEESRRAVALLGVLTATLVTGAFDAVLLLAPPTFLVWSSAGLLLPATGTAATLSRGARRRLVPLLLVFGFAAVTRSAGQLAAILITGPGWPVARLERAVRFDPGSYRLHLMIAQRTGCMTARAHARAAARLFPTLPAPKRRLAACGN